MHGPATDCELKPLCAVSALRVKRYLSVRQKLLTSLRTLLHSGAECVCEKPVKLRLRAASIIIQLGTVLLLEL